MLPISHSPNIKFVGHTDQGGRPDGVQIMVDRGYAYIGHMFSDGISVIDVRDPRAPAPVNFIACPPNTRAHHVQQHGDILLAVNSANVWALQKYMSQDDYYTKPIDDSFSRRERPFVAGLRVYDLSKNRAEPREIGFCPVEGIGLHRMWWTGGRYAYASAHIDGYTDFVLTIFDLADPTKPTLAGCWALPGMNRGANEEPQWPKGKRWALHHGIVANDTLYSAWRDGGFTIHDLKDPVAPKLQSHVLLAPPFAGGTHTPLPLPGRQLAIVADEAVSANCEAGLAHTWIFDVREKTNPVSIGTLPQPDETNYCAVGGKFGPHNLHENRPGSFQSENIIFATWHNAGVRAFDISNQFQPKSIGHFVPAAPTKLVDIRPGAALVIQSADVFVDKNGLMYITDTNAGLTIAQFENP